MFLKSLSLKNFRSFKNLTINFDQKINLITGDNGQGKTSILESIYYLALTQSFRTNLDKSCINKEEKAFEIIGEIENKKIKKKILRLYYSFPEGKHLFKNNVKIDKFSSHIGEIPCVVLTLNDINLTFGSPATRRKFIDVLLSQVSTIYLQALKNYRRIVQHRNALLSKEIFNLDDKKQLEIWNFKAAEEGSFIIFKRNEFIKYLNDNISELYRSFSGKNEFVSVKLKSTIDKNLLASEREKISEIFSEKLFNNFQNEREKCTTLTGPHRDDFDFLLDGNSFKEFGSHGENKTLIIVLKMLEWKYVSKKMSYPPVLLLDDIFGELDLSRMNNLLMFLGDVGQTFITTTLENKFSNKMVNNKIHLFQGKVRNES